MNSEYPRAPIGAVAKVRSGFAFKSTNWQNKGIPVVKIANVKNGRLEMNKCSYVSEDVATIAQDFLLREDDLLISMTGYVGDVAKVKKENIPCMLNQRVGRFYSYRDDVIDPNFLFFHLRHSDIRASIEQKAHGSAQPNISAGSIEEIEIYLPDFGNQKAIAHILSSLDDKIELNRKTNETLEAMAKLLFKSWFVDFDPVRAKAEGRPTGLPAEISDLFPDSFEDSELGEIPKGWRTVVLGDIYSVGKGGTWGEDSKISDDHHAYYCLRGIDCHNLSTGNFPDVPIRYIKQSHLKDRSPQEFSILVEGSGSFCGRSLLWESKYVKLLEEKVVYSNFCKRLDPISNKIFCSMTWMALSWFYEKEEVANFRIGTAFPNLDIKGLLLGMRFVLPPAEIATIFNDIFSQTNRLDLILQSKYLSQIRDTLLPKLISGELRIPDAEKILEEIGV